MSHSLKIVARPLSAAILGGSLVAAALIGGHFAVKTVKASKTFNRVVAVRGLAEREVTADLALWPISFRLCANDLPTLQAEIAAKRDTAVKFLLDQGFAQEEISKTPPKIHDFEASGDSSESKKLFRYYADASVVLRSAKAEKVVAAMQKADELIRDGVPLSQGEYGEQPKFLFVALQSVKPEMIEEATKDARAAAAKFAKDSSCKVGRIMRASQGSFEIEERDPQTPQRKTVRVVTSVDFLLE